MEEEIWKDVVGYEGYYQVSNLGNVYSLEILSIDSRKRSVYNKKGKLLIKIPTYSGYLKVKLYKRGVPGRFYFVHRIVIESFIGEQPTQNHRVNHINFDKKDNRPQNLEWVTRKQNSKHAYVGGKLLPPDRSKAVWQISLEGDKLKLWKSQTEAARNLKKRTATSINNCLCGITKTAYGYKWEYAD